MKQYRVKVIEMALKDNKIAKSGDVVSESKFTAKPGDLEKEGFIDPVGKDKKAKKEAEEKAKKEADNAKSDSKKSK